MNNDIISKENDSDEAVSSYSKESLSDILDRASDKLLLKYRVKQIVKSRITNRVLYYVIENKIDGSETKVSDIESWSNKLDVNFKSEVIYINSDEDIINMVHIIMDGSSKKSRDQIIKLIDADKLRYASKKEIEQYIKAVESNIEKGKDIHIKSVTFRHNGYDLKIDEVKIRIDEKEGEFTCKEYDEMIEKGMRMLPASKVLIDKHLDKNADYKIYFTNNKEIKNVILELVSDRGVSKLTFGELIDNISIILKEHNRVSLNTLEKVANTELDRIRHKQKKIIKERYYNCLSKKDILRLRCQLLELCNKDADLFCMSIKDLRLKAISFSSTDDKALKLGMIVKQDIVVIGDEDFYSIVLKKNNWVDIISNALLTLALRYGPEWQIEVYGNNKKYIDSRILVKTDNTELLRNTINKPGRSFTNLEKVIYSNIDRDLLMLLGSSKVDINNERFTRMFKRKD